MGWEQLAPAIQAAFDTYWRRKEATKGREHEKEIHRESMAHDKLMRELDRIQEKFIADRTYQLTKQGMEEEEARRKAELEAENERHRIDTNMEALKAADEAMLMREGWAEERASEREMFGAETQRLEDFATRTEEFTREHWGREEAEARLDRLSREKIAAERDAGGQFSVGDVAGTIMERADEAAALFKAGWEDFSAVFPRLLSKEQYDMLKGMGKDKDITDYLTTEIAKQYIQIYAGDALRAGIDLPRELNYFLELDEDKYMGTIRSAFDAAKAKQAEIQQTKKAIGRSPEAWREYRMGPSPLRGEKGETFERLKEAMERGKEGVDPYLERFMDIAEKAKEGVEGIFPSIFPWARADEEKKKKKKKK